MARWKRAIGSLMIATLASYLPSNMMRRAVAIFWSAVIAWSAALGLQSAIAGCISFTGTPSASLTSRVARVSVATRSSEFFFASAIRSNSSAGARSCFKRASTWSPVFVSSIAFQ